MQPWQTRSAALLGQAGMDSLSQATVLVLGLGGVGGHCAEALARGGVGHLLLVDHDAVSPTNLNRQLVALTDTLSRSKACVMAERIRALDPSIAVTARDVFYSPDNGAALLTPAPSFVVDAMDTVTAKVDLAVRCHEAGIPLISCMGAGNKLDPTAFRVTDLASTSVCPLARVMRRELKARGIEHLPVVFSTEPPLRAPVGETPPPGKHAVPGSLSFVPGAAGLALAGYVLLCLSGAPLPQGWPLPSNAVPLCPKPGL